MTIGLDTAVVLRLLTGSPTAQAEAARSFVASARHALVVSDLVVGESYFALRHHYGVPHVEAVRAIAALLEDARILATGVARGVMRDAVSRGAARSAVGIVDRLILADYGANQCELVTFDRDLARLDGARMLGT